MTFRTVLIWVLYKAICFTPDEIKKRSCWNTRIMNSEMTLFFSPKQTRCIIHSDMRIKPAHWLTIQLRLAKPCHKSPCISSPSLDAIKPGRKKSPSFVLPLCDLHTPTLILGGLSCVRGFRRDMSSLCVYWVTDRYVIYDNTTMRIKRYDFKWIRIWAIH